MLTVAGYICIFSAGFGSGAWWIRMMNKGKGRKYWKEVHDEEGWGYIQNQRP